VLCTLGAGPHEELLAIVRPTFEAYAARHGYDFVAETESLDDTRPLPWSKIVLFQRLMRSYELVLWIDCDAVIIDGSADIADSLSKKATFGLVAHATPEGPEIPNTGVVLIRSSRKAQRFLDRVWQRTEYIDHKWWENAAFLELLGYSADPPVTRVRETRDRKMFLYLDPLWNVLPFQDVERPRIKHYAGQTQEARVAGLTADVELTKRTITRQ